jgi:hypothetical protein
MSNNPTAAQRKVFEQQVELGCIACYLDGVYTQPCIHHGKENGGYRNHDFTLPLCPPHHQHEYAINGVPNRHKNPIEFRERYGTDRELHILTMRIIGGDYE